MRRSGLALLNLLLAAASLHALAESLPAFPLPVDASLSAATRRAAKPAVASRPLDDMEDAATWTLFGPGQRQLVTERFRNGQHSLRLTSPTKLDRPGPVAGRPFAETGVRRSFDHEDWTAFNRLAFDVYPHLPGFHTISLLVKFHAAGSDRWSYTFGQLHYVLLQPDQWNHVLWEIPHLPRTNVTALELTYRLQGHEPGATSTVQFDFDDLRLERVEHPDPFRGWEVAPGDFAYSQVGYRPDADKIALTSPDVTRFELREAGTDLLALAADTRRFTNALGRFALLDFSTVRRPGRYVLTTGAARTPPFDIGRRAWDRAVIATLNQYAAQRCGAAVPGIHGVCHQDWQVAHGDRRLPLAGGWHDAGDLSQGVVNTSEAALALLAAAEAVDRTGTDLSALGWRGPLLAEGRWGVDWILRTRFDDGFRATWATMDFWTDGLPGNADDVVAPAGDAPFDVLLAASANARAARLFARTAPELAARARTAAEADWRLVQSRLEPARTELVAAALNTALELHALRPDDGLRDRAVALGETLLAAQQKTPPEGWTVPLAGYFYTGPDRRRLLHYAHRGHDEAPVVALAGLCRAFPEHPQVNAWRDAVALHGRYLRQTAELSAPWFLPAAGIYSLRDTDPAQQRQIRHGIPLDADHYLRRFPVWGDFRGNSGILLSQARACAVAARLLDDRDLAQLARTILEWHLGRNPFAQSLMYGVGHNYTPQYTAMSGDITGGLPVGIQSRLDEDTPYWPASNCYNYSEIWIHPSTRLLQVLTDLDF